MANRKKQAKAAVVEARLTVSRIVGQNLPLPRKALDALREHTVLTGDHIITTSPVGSMPSDNLDLLALEMEANASQLGGKTGLPGELAGIMAWLSIAFYTGFVGRRDIGEAMIEYGFDSRTPEPDTHMIATEELAPLLDGSGNIFDPEFRRNSPQLAALADQAFAEADAISFDVDVVRGVGVASREPLELSSTRPGLQQHVSDADKEALAGIALLVASGEYGAEAFKFLTYFELELTHVFTRELEKSPALRANPPVVPMSTVREWIENEIERRP